LTLTEDYPLQSAEAIDFIDNGLKPVYQVTTALGREIKTTLSHPFLTLAGWQPLYELQVGDRVAVPRLIPVFGTCDVPEYEAKVLAYLIADGSLRGSSPQFSNTNPILRDDFSEASLNFPGNKVRLETSNGSRTPTIYVTQAIRDDIAPENFTHLCQILDVTETDLAANGYAQSSQVRNSLTHWLIQLGIWGKSALEKDVPAPVFEYTRSKLALFLNRLFACDGSIYLQNETQPVVSYATSSKALAQSVRHLLLRFGIIAKLRHRQVKYKNERRPSHQLRTTDAQSILAFVEEIGALGKEDAIEKVKARCQITHSNTNQDTIPVEVWELVMQAKGEQSWADLHRKMGYPASHNMHVGQRAPSRQRLQAIAQALSSDQLLELAQSDVYWDAIVAIEPLGKQQVYDLSVAVTHNFVADDMIVHNTSLQNAIALTAARRHGKRVAIFNLEMSGEQLVQRMIAAETRIDSQRLRRGQLYDHEWPIFLEAIGRLSETHIFIDDTPSITPLQLRTKCRRLYAEHGLDLVMIDYLQLMSSDRTNNNRVMEISEISRSLKTLARELDAPVLAAAQLSRAV
jgi:replicative DNA helicase